MYFYDFYQVEDFLNATGKSEGEVLRVSAVGGYGMQQSAVGGYGMQQSPQVYPERDIDRGTPQRSKSPKPSRSERGKQRIRLDRQEYYEPSSPKKGSSNRRAQSPSYRVQSPTRVSFEGVTHYFIHYFNHDLFVDPFFPCVYPTIQLSGSISSLYYSRF